MKEPEDQKEREDTKIMTEKLLLHLCGSIDDFIEKNKVNRASILSAFHCLCVTIFCKETDFKLKNQLLEIDFFCENIKKVAKAISIESRKEGLQ